MAATRGTQLLSKAGIPFALHQYDYAPNAEKIGVAAALALGIAPEVMLKTLMVEVDGKPACCVIPAPQSLAMKKVAAGFGGKQAEMMPPAKAEKLTGYKVGGISPFGMMRKVPVLFDATPLEAPQIWINAGQRGVLLSIAPQDALNILDAKPFSLCT